MICWPDAAYVSGWLLVEEGADGAAPPPHHHHNHHTNGSAPTLTTVARLCEPVRAPALLEYATLWYDGWHPSVPIPTTLFFRECWPSGN